MNHSEAFNQAMRDIKAQQDQLNQKRRAMFGDFFAGNLSQEDLAKQMYDPLGQLHAKPKFRNMAELNAALDAQRKAAALRPAPPKPNPVDPVKRRDEINDELDIIRGIKPTPAGYKVDPTKVKQLMAELRELA